MRYRSYVWIVLLALAGAVPAAALAAKTTLTISPPATASFGVTLNGTDQTGSYSLDVPVSYTSGKNENNKDASDGWSITATSTVFTGRQTGRTLSTTASTLTVSDDSGCDGKKCSDPVNSVTYPLPLPAGTVAPTAVTIVNAAAGSGVGSNTETIQVTVAIPANTYADQYTSTLTLAAIEGP